MRAGIQASNISSTMPWPYGPTAEKRFIIPPPAPDGNPELPALLCAAGAEPGGAKGRGWMRFVTTPKYKPGQQTASGGARQPRKSTQHICVLFLLVFSAWIFFSLTNFSLKKKGFEVCAEPRGILVALSPLGGGGGFSGDLALLKVHGFGVQKGSEGF